MRLIILTAYVLNLTLVLTLLLISFKGLWNRIWTPDNDLVMDASARDLGHTTPLDTLFYGLREEYSYSIWPLRPHNMAFKQISERLTT